MMHTQNDNYSNGDIPARCSPFEDDVVAYQFIQNEDTLKFETELFVKKWFDYRHLTPLQATRLYIQAYDTVFRRHYAQNVDHTAAKYVRTVNIDDIFNGLAAPESSGHKKAKMQFTACWHGRQMADLLGMPYEIYLDLAFEYRLRYWNKPYLPQPQHLYSDLVVDRIQTRWPELQSSRLYTSDHPAYHMENYQDLPHQNAYHEWLFEQADKRANPGEMLGRFVNEDLLPVEKIKARVSEGVFEIARSYIQ